MSGLDEDILDYLAGELDEERLAALDRLLVQDAAAARRFAELSTQEMALRGTLRLVETADAMVHRRQPSIRRPRRRLHISRPWWPVAISAVLMLAVATLLLVRQANGPAPFLTVVAGQGQWTEHGVVHEVQVGARLGADARLENTARLPLVLAYADGTRVDLGQASALTLRAAAPGKRLELLHGEMNAEVAPQPSGAPLVITTAQAQAEVVGTRFRLVAEEDATRLEVDQGRVLFTHRRNRRAVLVEAGLSCEITAADAFDAHPIVRHNATASPPPEGLPSDARILYREDFAHAPSGWIGEPRSPSGTVTDAAIGSVLLQPRTCFLGEIRSPFDASGWPAGATTYLRFRYRAEGCIASDSLKVMLKGRDQTNFGGFLRPMLDSWTTVTIRMDSSIGFILDPLRHLQTGETIHQLVWIATAIEPREATKMQLWVADVVVFSSASDVPTMPLQR